MSAPSSRPRAGQDSPRREEYRYPFVDRLLGREPAVRGRLDRRLEGEPGRGESVQVAAEGARMVASPADTQRGGRAPEPLGQVVGDEPGRPAILAYDGPGLGREKGRVPDHEDEAAAGPEHAGHGG